MADKDLHARLVVHDIDTMSKEDHTRLVDWLHKLAHDIRKIPQERYSRKFTARLWK